uniref:Dynein light chain n=1 Tax=Strongyloides venezuelensis TaxID=75913 RepID=A0A0K0FVS6_STRVS
MNNVRMLTPPPMAKSLSTTDIEDSIIGKNTSRVHFQTTSLSNMGRAFTHPLIQDCNMPPEIRMEAVYLAMVSCERYKKDYKKIAKDLHVRLMKKFGGEWNIIVGENFGLQIAYDPKSLLYMFCGIDIAICIWKSL